MDIEKLRIIQSEEYELYIKALCRRASFWVPSIRQQYAKKAYELYQNPTIRKVVLAYGAEVEKQDADILREFSGLAENPEAEFYSLEGSCLIHAKEYGQTIDLLFDIQH